MHAPNRGRIGDILTTGAIVPPYYRIKEALLEYVSGMPPGYALPTERALSEQYGVSRTTVRRALHDLLIEGRVTRHQGRGTFVAEPKILQELRLVGYTQDMTERGIVPGSRILSIAELTDDPELAVALDLQPSSSVLSIARLRLADGNPMAVETMYVSYDRFSRLTDMITENSSVYALMRNEFQVELDHAEETIESAVASPAEADLLGTEVGGPILMLSRKSYDSDDRIVELVKSFYRGDRFRFVVQLT